MSDEIVTNGNRKNPSKLTIGLDLRLICAVLLLVIVAMLVIWKPWGGEPTDASRTISVTGESTLKATPDEYVFSPQYEFKDTDKATALADLTAKQNEIVSALKKLGVPDSSIKADSNGNDYRYEYDDIARTSNYSLVLTITLKDKDLTQKVQDYLLTTGPTGTVSPQASFSDATRKKLENQGRNAATKEARAKAEQSAHNLGFEVGAVKSVSDSANGLATPPMYAMESGVNADTKQGLSVQPGQNELSYSVTVVYYLK